MYTLKKLSLVPGHNSMVKVGHTQDSNRLMIFKIGEEDAKEIDDIHKLEIGWNVILSRGTKFLQTSPVQEVTKIDENCVHFLTWTSIYELRKVE